MSKVKRIATGKPRVAIVTSLVDYSPAYSLVGIILDQARALKRHGYDYDLFCLKNFNEQDMKALKAEGLNVRYELSQCYLVDYKPNQPAVNDGERLNGQIHKEGFETQANIYFEGRPEKGQKGYKDVLGEYDVIITHDLMFLSWHLPQNAALRKCIDLWPEKNWLHWVHSGPSSPPPDVCYPSTLRFSAAPNSHYVYLNERQRLDYALMIHAQKSLVHTVYNPKDLRDVWRFSKDTCEFIDRYDLFDHQILQVYPFSTPRWKDKGVNRLLKIFAFWKKQKIRARLVLINAHANNKVDIPRIEAMEAYCKVADLTLGDDVILTSRYADEVGKKAWKYTVPFQVVRELMLMSNVFIFPSLSECCSLIQAEASISGGKLMVLNRDFPPMLEFCSENVLHYEFKVNDPERNPGYYECVAREVWANLMAESSIVNTTKARTQTYNRDWIFRNQLEPLLYLGFSDRHIREGEKQGEVLRPEFKAPEVVRNPQVGVRPPMIEYTGDDGQSQQVEMSEVVVKRTPGGARVFQPIPGKNAVVDAAYDTVETKTEEGSLEDTKVIEAPNCADTVDPNTGTLEPVEEDRPAPEVFAQPPDYNEPWDGMECPIFKECSKEQKQECYASAGHCLVLDELTV